MWNVKSKQIPVTTEANGTVSKSVRKNPSNIQGKSDKDNVQKKINILHWTHTVGSANVKVHNVQHGK